MLGKILAMNVAAQLTHAAMSGAGNALPVDPQLADATVRARNLQAYETFKVFYAAVSRALENADNSWPEPNVDLTAVVGKLAGALAPLLAGQGPLAALAAPLLSRLLAPTAKLPAVLPNPGEPVK